MARMIALSECKVTDATVDAYLKRALTYPASNSDDSTTVSERSLNAVQELYSGKGLGAQLASSTGTAWALLNSVTEYVDHHRRSQSDDHRPSVAN
jgi:hypothetical protein